MYMRERADEVDTKTEVPHYTDPFSVDAVVTWEERFATLPGEASRIGPPIGRTTPSGDGRAEP